MCSTVILDMVRKKSSVPAGISAPIVTELTCVSLITQLFFVYSRYHEASYKESGQLN
jgi:hypothetical protein